ncbi:MAG: phenylalanine--tRNA ligase subunit beta [Candidatus Eremiobacteraeota bacterium]|nr:phenylalanine--tRNA ligase subunit beta [Candidatus Eremiobacteraeota bacterium]
MRVPISWLREYVDLPDSQATADRLSSLGFPVEDIERRPQITGVVTGKIVSLEKHPNADRLQVAAVDVGESAPITIATAATNVELNQIIPVARIRAQLPHLTIEPRTMRGIQSQGMMCSAEELALEPAWFEDGIMILDPLTPLGQDVVERFGLDDDVLEVEITSNRVDAMSMVGLARELAASYGTPLRLPSFENPNLEPDPPGEAPSADIQTLACTRFVAQLFTGVHVERAPAWMRVRLALAGQRPVNNLVDISNYVMLEVAQPLHFYDADAVADHRFIVRDGRDGEELTTLDDLQRSLSGQSLVVADSNGPLGLAGLMGGARSAVRESTSSVLLESAAFEGARVRRMSASLGLRTEASSRHEKALAPALADIAAARAAALLAGLGAQAHPAHTFGAAPATATPIELRARDVERLLGLRLESSRIASHLRGLGCDVETQGDAMRVTPPAWRGDLTIPADLVEEVARIEGYDRIEAVEPQIPAHALRSAEYALEQTISRTLAALGYNEILSYSLHGSGVFERMARAGMTPSHAAVEVRNPLSEDQRYLRTSLEIGLLAYFARTPGPQRIFELGHVFMNDGGHAAEVAALTFGFTGEATDEPAGRDSGFLLLKGDCEALLRAVSGVATTTARDARNGLHPGKSAVLMHDGREIANFGRVDPRLCKTFDVALPAYVCNIYLGALPERLTPSYRPPSKYPSTYRDLAVVVALDVPSERVAALMRDAIGMLCTGVRVFDEYRGEQIGEGRKSLAVRALIQRYDATITDDEADAAMKRAFDALHDEVGAVIRT